MIYGFKTANSEYYIDLIHNTISGGKLGNKIMNYMPGTAKFIVGAPGYAEFIGGGYIKTGVIKKYLEA